MTALGGSFAHGSWVVSWNQEVLPEATASLATQKERAWAAEEIRVMNLKEAVERAKKRPRPIGIRARAESGSLIARKEESPAHG